MREIGRALERLQGSEGHRGNTCCQLMPMGCSRSLILIPHSMTAKQGLPGW